MLWWTSGAPAPDFPIGSACCCNSGRFRFWRAPRGWGSRSPRHVSCARAERRLLGYASRDDLSTSRREPPAEAATDSDTDLPARPAPLWGVPRPWVRAVTRASRGGRSIFSASVHARASRQGTDAGGRRWNQRAISEGRCTLACSRCCEMAASCSVIGFSRSSSTRCKTSVTSSCRAGSELPLSVACAAVRMVSFSQSPRNLPSRFAASLAARRVSISTPRTVQVSAELVRLFSRSVLPPPSAVFVSSPSASPLVGAVSASPRSVLPTSGSVGLSGRFVFSSIPHPLGRAHSVRHMKTLAHTVQAECKTGVGQDAQRRGHSSERAALP